MANEQSLQNHARYEPLYHYVAFPLFAINLGHAIAHLRPLTEESGVRLGLAVALVLLGWFARAFPLTAQNRIIRLEERLRLRDLAPELAAQSARITPGQWTALRFASDDELPELVRQVLDGKLASGADIKKAIRHWRADHLRV